MPKSEAGIHSLKALSQFALPLVLLLVCAVFAAIDPVFLTPDNLVSILHQVAIIGIMAMGMTFVIMTGGIDLSVGPVLAVAGLIAALVLSATGGSTLVAIVAALSAAALIGLCNGLCVAWLELPPIVVTLASLSIVRGGALLVGGPNVQMIGGPEAFLFIGSGIVGGIPLTVFAFLASALLAIFLQYNAVFGVKVLAVGDNQRAARLSGHNIILTKTLTYILCSTAAGFAGVLQASQVRTASANYGNGIELDVIAAVVLGGTSLLGGSGSVVRTVLGVLLIGIINDGLGILNVSVDAQLVAKGLIIIVALALSNLRSTSTP